MIQQSDLSEVEVLGEGNINVNDTPQADTRLGVVPALQSN